MVPRGLLASKNGGLFVYRTKRLKGTLSISCDSNVILDFEDNYIYIVCSETLKIGESEFNIGCFIGMERSCHHITIYNLTLYG